MQTRYETHALLRHTKENEKDVLINVTTNAETSVKRMHCDAIPRKTQKPS